MWEHKHSGQEAAAGYTFVENGRLAKRIDSVWAKNIPLAQIRSVEFTAGEEDHLGNRASDHYGLLVTLDS